MRFGRVELNAWSPSVSMKLVWMPAEKRLGAGKKLFGYFGNRAANLCDACDAVVLQPPD